MCLLLPERHTVGALIHAGIGFMGAHKNFVQRTVVGAVAVVCALAYGAFNALVCVIGHDFSLLLLYSKLVCPRLKNL